MQQSGGINIPVKREYDIPERLFCVPVFRQCTNTSDYELTKQQRTRRKRMMAQQHPSSSFVIDQKTKALQNLLPMSTIKLLQQLYTNQDQQYRTLVFQALKTKRLNPIYKKQTDRDDLQYYIPQLLTYLAFQQDLCDHQLIDLLINACEIHFFFSHHCYFYLNSMSIIDGKEIHQITTFIKQTFLPPMKIYDDHILTGAQLLKSQENTLILKRKISQFQMIAQQKYGTIEEDQIQIQFVDSIDIKNFGYSGYLSTPNFWYELVKIGENLSHCNPKIVGLRKQLRQLNKKLPAAVYLPFLKFRNYVIVNINVQTARVFSTKQRAPYSINLEIVKQQQQFFKDEADLKHIYKRLIKAITVASNRNSLKLPLQQRKSSKIEDYRSSIRKTKDIIQQSKKQHILPNYEKKEEQVKLQKIIEQKQSLEKQQDQEQAQQYENMSISDELDKQSIATHTQQMFPYEQSYINKYFDISYKDVENGIRSKSIYKHFKTWKLVNIMIKTGDNLKQQQFAMQMINQFNIVFQKQETGLFLKPYEVISIGPDSGIMEMVIDSCPLGKVIKIMKSEKIFSLKQFFKVQFKDNYKNAQKNFCKSLAAYSLVTYFLQVKDRHNENILLHKDGYIVHIDFGFFLSNAPGQGIQLQKNVPFKLMSSYVDVLGGYNSRLFMQFRILFQKGFKASLKHKQDLIMLVRMMYSTHGQSMPCFKKGQMCIEQLESRFSLKTQNITQHCQNLINLSLDNWRAKWYDKFQYWLQGIFY